MSLGGIAIASAAKVALDEHRAQSAPEKATKKSVRKGPPIILIGRSSSASNVHSRESRQHREVMQKGYFETLKPSELGNLRIVFDRVDPGHTGFVMMDDFIGRLDKAKTVDHFLKTAYNFLMHSISAERRMGFKSFRDIIALLLPTASANRVDAIIQAGEQWMDQRLERKKSRRLSRERWSAPDKIQTAARRAAIARLFSLEKDSDEEDNEALPRDDISLSKLQELKYMFAELDTHGNGRVDIKDLERYFGTQDDIRSLLQRQTKQPDMRKLEKHVLDFDGFVKLMLPNGYSPCKYPDPDKVPTASSEQIFRWLHDDISPSSGLGQGRSIRPGSATESTSGEHGNGSPSHSSSVSLPALPGLPEVPKANKWQSGRILESRTLK